MIIIINIVADVRSDYSEPHYHNRNYICVQKIFEDLVFLISIIYNIFYYNTCTHVLYVV